MTVSGSCLIINTNNKFEAGILQMAPEVNVSQIKKAARNAIPISIKTYTLPRETEMYLEEVLGVFLSEFGQQHLTDRIAYCLKELSVNAKKANTKRVYFKEKNFDIGNSRDYNEGMKHFKEETLSNIQHYLKK